MMKFVPGQVTVKFSSDVPRWRVERLFRDVQGKELVFQGADNSYVMEVPAGSEDAACLHLRNSAFVLYAEPVYIDRVKVVL